ncbi:TPA: hypothetical protein QDB03_003836 [Burkholderia vietnamiensis]|nr:hypothetical protein [Burkholderia vietnamiensis]
MSDLAAAATGSTEPAVPMTDAERAALPDWVKNGQPPAQEAGTAATGEISAAPAAAAPGDISVTTSADVAASGATPVAGEPGNAGASAALLSPDAGLFAAPLSPAAPGADSDGGSVEPGIQAAGDSINLGAHLSRLDGMLAEIERKIAAGIHTFAHEITSAREHLAKLL